MINLIKEKDAVTYNHCINVAKLCHDFCLFLGKEETYASEMHAAGLLHDIGKIDVPDEILNKPGTLTDEEFSVMRRHTEFSLSYLKEASKLVRNVAWGHHLSYAGGGYPDSTLSGKNIPEECRIAAICDVFEALTAKRQYKDGMSTQAALTKMSSFKQLDPELFEEFKKFI